MHVAEFTLRAKPGHYTGYLEATREEVTEQNSLAPTNPYPSAAEDWIRVRHVGLIAQRRWDETPDVRDWIERSRLNVASGLQDHAGEGRCRAGDWVVPRQQRSGDQEPRSSSGPAP